jgi:hypothetical protein
MLSRIRMTINDSSWCIFGGELNKIHKSVNTYSQRIHPLLLDYLLLFVFCVQVW